MKIGLRVSALLLTSVVAGCGMTVFRPPDAQRELQFPDDLEVYGLAFHGGKVYATTGQAILEFDQGRLSGVCRWQSGDRVIRSQGPWINRADGSLWFKEGGAKFLIRLNQDKWSSQPLPETRGDFLPIRYYYNEDFSGHSDARGFWFSSSLETWRWDPALGGWREENLPTLRSGGVVSVAPLEGSLLAILWKNDPSLRLVDALEGRPFESDGVYVREEGKDWRELRNDAGPIAAANLVTSGRAAYFCNRAKGEVIEATPRGLRRVEVPGACEALTVTGDGVLVASFLNQGIFKYSAPDGPWTLLYPCPYPPKDRRHRTVLTEDRGTVVLAVTDSFHPRPAVPDRRATIWASRDGRLQKLEW